MNFTPQIQCILFPFIVFKFPSSKIILPAKLSFQGNFLPFSLGGTRADQIPRLFMILKLKAKIPPSVGIPFQQKYPSNKIILPGELPSNFLEHHFPEEFTFRTFQFLSMRNA